MVIHESCDLRKQEAKPKAFKTPHCPPPRPPNSFCPPPHKTNTHTITLRSISTSCASWEMDEVAVGSDSVGTMWPTDFLCGARLCEGQLAGESCCNSILAENAVQYAKPVCLLCKRTGVCHHYVIWYLSLPCEKATWRDCCPLSCVSVWIQWMSKVNNSQAKGKHKDIS